MGKEGHALGLKGGTEETKSWGGRRRWEGAWIWAGCQG